MRTQVPTNSTADSGVFKLIRLSKFDNQAGEYKLYRYVWVYKDKLAEFTKTLGSGVKGFYLYEWSHEGIPLRHYSLNPDVFASIEETKTHMT